MNLLHLLALIGSAHLGRVRETERQGSSLLEAGPRNFAPAQSEETYGLLIT